MAYVWHANNETVAALDSAPEFDDEVLLFAVQWVSSHEPGVYLIYLKQDLLF